MQLGPSCSVRLHSILQEIIMLIRNICVVSNKTQMDSHNTGLSSRKMPGILVSSHSLKTTLWHATEHQVRLKA